MAAIHEPPRKKLATYGKVARRRVTPGNPQYSAVFFGATSPSQEEQVQEAVEIPIPANALTPPRVQDKQEKSSRDTRELVSAPSPIDVFDVPDDDIPVVKLKKKVLKPATIRTKSAPILSKSVFDLPPDEEKSVEKPVTMQKNTLKSTIHTSRPLSSPRPRKLNSEVVAKLGQPETTTQPTKAVVEKVPVQTTATSISKPLGKSLQRVTTRPGASTSNDAVKPKSLERVDPSRKLNAQQVSASIQRKYGQRNKNTASNSNTTADVMEIDMPPAKISPKGMKLWKELLEPDFDAQNPIGSSKVSTNKKVSPISSRTLCKPAGVIKNRSKGSPSISRKRLIDFLVDQASSESEDESSEGDEEDVMEGVETERSSVGVASRAHSVVPEAATKSVSISQNSQGTGPKFVYGEKRTILAEQDFMQTLQIEMSTQDSATRRSRRGSIPSLPALPSFHDVDIEEEEGTNVKVRNVHELRQAGVNGRFLDELDDFFDRIGTPESGSVSMRRSGLLDLATKLRDKSFARQFRSNAAEDRLFIHLGQETDTVTGFMLVSLLLTLFADGSLPHVITQLRHQGITRLLLRLLDQEMGIIPISKERKANMSKISQSLIAEYHTQLLQSSIWEQLKPEIITPRTVALKCLEKMIRQTRESGNSDNIFSKELTKYLFAVLKTASDEKAWQNPSKNADFLLALSALESYAITAKVSSNEAIWVGEYLPIVANVLQVALSQPTFGDAQLLILRLALNVTNNNHKGADVFATPGLLVVMGQVIISRFKQLTRFLFEEEFFKVLDQLVLTLGVMINFAEWSTLARKALQSLEGRSDDPLDRMAQLFLDNRERMAEADSVEESQKNVAFGYLSVLLGYLALHAPIATRFRKRNPKHTLQPLVSSIEEFIGHHRAVDNIIASDGDGHSPHTGLTERLESLVANLEGLA